MGFRGGRGGGGRFSRGGGRGGGGFNNRGRGGGKFGARSGGFGQDDGPPERVVEFGRYIHPCQNQLIIKSSIEEVPFFNAPIYTEDKHRIGKVDEIFGSIRDYYISVELMENFFANSFKVDTKFYVDPVKLLPLSRFLGSPGGAKKNNGSKSGGSGRGGRGGRSNFTGNRTGGRGGGNRGGRSNFGIGNRGRGGNAFRSGFRGRR